MSWFNRVLSRLQQKGFTLANKGHKIAINGLLVVIAYQGYSFFREYNNFFIDARQVKSSVQKNTIKENQPLNKITKKQEKQLFSKQN